MMLKKKSIFNGILLLIIISFVCVIVTVLISLLAGAADVEIFDFSNINISNMVPVLIVGGITSCFIIGISALFVSRIIFFKVNDYISEKDKKEDRRNEK